MIHSQVIGPDGLPEGPEFVSDPVAIGSLYGILQPKLTALAEGYLLIWDNGAEPFGHGIHSVGRQSVLPGAHGARQRRPRRHLDRI